MNTENTIFGSEACCIQSKELYVVLEEVFIHFFYFCAFAYSSIFFPQYVLQISVRLLLIPNVKIDYIKIQASSISMHPKHGDRKLKKGKL